MMLSFAFFYTIQFLIEPIPYAVQIDIETNPNSFTLIYFTFNMKR